MPKQAEVRDASFILNWPVLKIVSTIGSLKTKKRMPIGRAKKIIRRKAKEKLS